MAGSLEVLDIEKLLFVSASLPFKGLYDVLDGSVVNVLVVRDPHLVFPKDLVHVDEVDPVRVADLLVRAILLICVF
jgi:hypothetical protein